MKKTLPLIACLLSTFAVACTSTQPTPAAASKPAEAPKPDGYRIYVSNERSGDLSIIDSTTQTVIATTPLGKRPRGIHASPDGKTIYVALSGSAIGGPGVDESKLPPPDKKAD